MTDRLDPYVGQKHPTNAASVQTNLNGFDPRQLLDPKGFDKSSRPIEQRNNSDKYSSGSPQSSLGKAPLNVNQYPEVTFTASKSDHGDYEESEMSSLLEKTYNIGNRQEPPQKKQKTDQTEQFEDDRENLKYVGSRGGGGELGEYVTQKRQEGLQDSTAALGNVVDLTQGCSLAI